MVLTAEVYSGHDSHPPLPWAGGICRDTVHNRTDTRTQDPSPGLVPFLGTAIITWCIYPLGWFSNPASYIKFSIIKKKVLCSPTDISVLIPGPRMLHWAWRYMSRARRVAGSTTVNNHVFTSPLNSFTASKHLWKPVFPRHYYVKAQGTKDWVRKFLCPHRADSLEPWFSNSVTTIHF